MAWIWLSTPKFTVSVDLDTTGRVTQAAPIMRVFNGQDYQNLLGWANKKWPQETRWKIYG